MTRLGTLDHEPAFALLGPGYSPRGPRLLRGLRPEPRNPCLLFASYESPGERARGYQADIEAISIEPEETSPLELSLNEVGYLEAIADIRASIAAGDVYQVNYSRRVQLEDIPGSALASRLCRRGMPAYFAWVRFPEGDELVSASPELFFSISGRRVFCQPMKGTAGAGMEGALAASDKDRAELAMITDLMRNDLTPVCESGSIRVLEERRYLSLPYAVQAVSEIEGRLQPDIGPREVLAALHPGGSITGAPKRAAMAAISRLEESPRGPYCGSLGFLQGDEARFSILIRTAARNAAGWSYGVGGGIVWQSEAASELRELYLKLGALR